MQPAASPQHRHDIKALDKQVADLITGIKHLARTEDLEELRAKVFPRPGWTTPAEFLLVSAAVTALLAQVNAAAALKQHVAEASRTIGA
jgi:hypothetical protein